MKLFYHAKRTRLYNLNCLFLAVAFALNLMPFSSAHAQAQLGVLKVRILEGGGNECQDAFGSDFYFKVKVNNQTFSTRNRPIHVGAATIIVNLPVDREFRAMVDVSESIRIRFEQWEKDDSSILFGDDDDICDVFPGSGNAIDIVLNPGTCQVSGDVTGSCDTTLGFDGFPEHFLFSLSLESPSSSVGGLRIRCLHEPIWPKPEEKVTITAETVDDEANLISVDTLKIFAGDDKLVELRKSAVNTSTLQVDHTPDKGITELLYRCDATEKGDPLSSGWHRIQIGPPEKGRAVGILNTGASNHGVDIVFIADKSSYCGGSSVKDFSECGNANQFLKDVRQIIRDVYYAGDALSPTDAGFLFLQNQQLVNFWLALDPADASGTGLGPCTLKPSDNWGTDYSFADAGAIVHTTLFRDCADMGQRVFAAPVGDTGVILHETAHVPFGLADEYCCDGGYFRAKSLPNVYDNHDDCVHDPLAADLVSPCEQIADTTTTVPWFRLDSDSPSIKNNDLMASKPEGDAQAADARRINDHFNTCRRLKLNNSPVQGLC